MSRKVFGNAVRGSAKVTAGVGRRILGGVVDLLITAIFVLSFAYLTGQSEPTVSTTYSTTVPESGEPSNSVETQVAMHVPGWVGLSGSLICFLVFSVLEALVGKTPGKFVAGTLVVAKNGDHITFRQSLIRNMLRFVDGIGLYLLGLIFVIAREDNRRVGDLAAKTIVVRS